MVYEAECFRSRTETLKENEQPPSKDDNMVKATINTEQSIRRPR